MRRIDRTRSASSALFGLAVVLTACMSRAPQPTAIATQVSAVDSIAARLAALELERIASRVDVSRGPASTANIESQIESLHERLQRLRTDGSATRVGVERVLLALAAREESVSSQLRQARLAYTDQYPPVRRLIDETRLLQQRRTEILTSGR
jgi:hypothetical protein